MAELMLSLLLIGVGGVVWAMRDNTNPAALWTWGWVVVAGTVALLRFGDDVQWSNYAAHLLSPLLPGFVLAGALLYADRECPTWLLPAALGLGAVRWSLASSDAAAVANLIGVVIEPAAYAASAWLAFRVARRGQASIAQNLLAPAFIAVGTLEAFTAVSVLSGRGLTGFLSVAWGTVALSSLGIQITAAGHRARKLRETLQREREEARQALEDSEQRLLVLAEDATDVIFESDTDGHILYVSPNILAMLGRTAEETRNAPPFSFTHPEDREQGSTEHDRALTTSEQHGILARAQHADGSWRWIETKMRSFESAAGERRIVGIARDVTDRQEQQAALTQMNESLELRVADRTRELRDTVKKLELEAGTRKSIEEQLRESRARYRAVSELSSDFAFGLRLDPDGEIRIEWMSDAFERMTGYSPAELDGLGWRNLVTADHWVAAREHVEALRAGRSVEFEGLVNTRHGRQIYLHTRLSADTRGDRLALVGASRDITARRNAEDERRDLEQHMHEVQRLESLGVLAGGIAHDFNNLLSVILGNSSLALSDLGEASPAALRLHRIRAAAQHAAGLTEQMLTYSGRTPSTLKPVSLSDVVHDIADLLRASLDNKITLSFDASDGPAPTYGDITQLRQIVINLVINAGEAIGDTRGTVTVRTGTLELTGDEASSSAATAEPLPGTYACLSVSDTGAGMDHATQMRIFEPFYTTRHSGRGLGLAAVLGIVQGHGGHIQLESQLGEGTTFRVLFPISDTQVIEAADHAPTKDAPFLRRVLLVDDEPLVIEVGAEFLRRAGFEVVTASSGNQALERIAEAGEPFDAVVLDVVMPNLDGEETLRAIRKTQAQLPVILTSGYDKARSGEWSDPDEHVEFLRKPYEPQELIEKVSQALEQ